MVAVPLPPELKFQNAPRRLLVPTPIPVGFWSWVPFRSENKTLPDTAPPVTVRLVPPPLPVGATTSFKEPFWRVAPGPTDKPAPKEGPPCMNSIASPVRRLTAPPT
jgi:hypothetical protein